jgi:BlaI family penicillinase repressor
MPKQPPSISEAEWQVMDVIWDHKSPVTANDIVERLADKADWNPRTIKTMLNRLVGKGALGYTAEGKRYWYEPLFSRAECVRAQSRSFLSRVFGGAAGAAMLHFVEEHDLTPGEIEQLKKVLSRKGR